MLYYGDFLTTCQMDVVGIQPLAILKKYTQ